MIGRLNHVAIAVRDVEAAALVYKNTLGAKITGKVAQPDHSVSTVFVELPNTKIELIEPLGENSPIENFLKANPKGGMHHLCYEVEDIEAACEQMRKMGATITGTGKPRIGAHGKPVVFMHPKDFNGTLIELEQV